jgi:hypothetical protein
MMHGTMNVNNVNLIFYFELRRTSDSVVSIASIYKDNEGLIVSSFVENTLTCNIRTLKRFRSKLN